MLFNTPLFFWFFSVFFCLYHFVFRTQRQLLWLILLSSLLFYASWNYAFVPLLVFTAFLDFNVGQQIALNRAAGKPVIMKRWLLFSIIANLSVLGFFKYNNFLLASVRDFLNLFGVSANLPVLSVVLPVGISFYTFQSMSYVMDVYRGHLKAHKSFLEFFGAVSFFPQLVAGPILRAADILPQISKLPLASPRQIRLGLLLIVVGLLKKNMADLLAGTVATVFDHPAQLSTLEAWTGALAFTAQIYADFSGYTDIAIGLAMLLGITIPANFRLPYLSTSPVEFWRRWHISLSSWLRDYLYVSLGGNRHGKRWRNVIITMLLGGLWHGAAWTFVAWGLWHGVLIALTHAISNSVCGRWLAQYSRHLKPVKILLCFYLVVIGWVLFRAQSFGSAAGLLKQMHSWHSLLPQDPTAPITALLVLTALILHHTMDWALLRFEDGILKRSWLIFLLLLIGFFINFLIGEPGHAFIYFQF